MRILIAGIDGYLGWALTQSLLSRGHQVGGIDAGFRRQWVEEMNSTSAVPIADREARLAALQEHWGVDVWWDEGDLTDWNLVRGVFEEFKPEAIVHLGECPSAPYSMIDVHHANWVQTNNITGTFNILFAMREVTPEAHLVKLGTMGEYGTPNMDIPEGFLDLEFRGRKERMPFPRQAGSWYHWSKVHGSNNVMFASRIWGIRATDVMQGVVFGTRTEEMPEDPRLATRLDFDQAFGTAINRFCCQTVIGHPLTLYGKGHQKRGFLPLRDSMQCLNLALDNPPQEGEYRVFNQFEEVYDLTELAQMVKAVAATLGLKVQIRYLENPRKELESHYYKPDHQHLLDLGYRPTRDVSTEIQSMLEHLREHKDRIEAHRDALIPDVHWKDGQRRKVSFLEAGQPD